jgi:hypothetical protein
MMQVSPSPAGPFSLAPSTIAQWFGAVATSAAVFVALFKDEFLKHRRRPKLTVRIDPEPPDCILVPKSKFVDDTGKTLSQGNVYWLRLWIENTGISRAEQVQVFAAKLRKKDVNGRFAPVQDFLPMNLRWSNPRDPNNPEIFAPGLSRHFGKHCDLCSISDPSDQTAPGQEGKCIGRLQVEAHPSDNRNRLLPAKYVLEIRVGAANADPVTTYVRIDITGSWSPDRDTMFREHLGVGVLDGADIASNITDGP